MLRLTVWRPGTAPVVLGDDVLLSGSWWRLMRFYETTPDRVPWWWHVETYDTGRCVSAQMHPVTWNRYWTTERFWIREVTRRWGHQCYGAPIVSHVSPMRPPKVAEMARFG